MSMCQAGLLLGWLHREDLEFKQQHIYASLTIVNPRPWATNCNYSTYRIHANYTYRKRLLKIVEFLSDTKFQNKNLLPGTSKIGRGFADPFTVSILQIFSSAKLALFGCHVAQITMAALFADFNLRPPPIHKLDGHQIYRYRNQQISTPKCVTFAEHSGWGGCERNTLIRVVVNLVQTKEGRRRGPFKLPYAKSVLCQV